MALETSRVRVGDRVIRLCADNNTYAGVYTVRLIKPDLLVRSGTTFRGKRCTVFIVGPSGKEETLRARLLADGETAVAHLRRAA